MLSIREKNIIASIDLMFKGMDNPELKAVMLACALGKTEEEKDRICEEIRKKKEDDHRYYTDKFEVVCDESNPLQASTLVRQDATRDITDVN